jgi:hypothetical protein
MSLTDIGRFFSVGAILRRDGRLASADRLEDETDNVGRDKDDEVPFGSEQRVGMAETGDAVAENGVCPRREEGWSEDETVGQWVEVWF